MAPAPHLPHCPRCGYDMSGAMATWHPSGPAADGACCPCDATCSECGLLFAWRLALRPELANATWFVECVAPRRRRHSVLRTTFHALAPWRFWRAVALETPRAPGRRLWWLLWSVLLTPMVTYAMGSLLQAITFVIWMPPMWWNGTAWTPGLTPPPSEAVGLISRRWLDDMLHPLSTLQTIADDTPLKAFFVPLIACGVSFPAMLVLLPITRARSKVSLGHIARAASYALAPFPLAAIIAALLAIDLSQLPGAWNTLEMWQTDFRHALRQTPRGYLIGYTWFVVWWYFALSRGFRMPDWRPALLSMTVPAGLFMIIVAIYVSAGGM